MMKQKFLIGSIVVLSSAVLLGSCGGGVPPSGQVLAGGRLLTIDAQTRKICGDAVDPGIPKTAKMFGAQRCEDALSGTAKAGSTEATARAEIRGSEHRAPFVLLNCEAGAKARRSNPPIRVLKKATASAEATQTFILPRNGNWRARSHVNWEAAASQDQASAKYSFKVLLTGLGAELFKHETGPNNSATSPPDTIYRSQGLGEEKQKTLRLQRGVRYTMSCEITGEATAMEKPPPYEGQWSFPKGDGSMVLYFSVSQ